MEKTDYHRGCRIDAAVAPTSGPKLHTSYKITPETDEAKVIYEGVWEKVGGSHSEIYADIDELNGPDPLAEAIDFTISQAKGEIDQIAAAEEQKK